MPVIPFPSRGRHVRASAKAFLAAKSASTSAVSPRLRATEVCNIDRHHSEGMLFRCDHLRTAGTDAPVSSAISSLDSQYLITSRNDDGLLTMPDLLGQSVLKSKAKVSRAIEPVLGDYVSLMDRMTETEEKAFFIGRTKAARLARYETQGPICTILEIDQGTYKQYETRTPLPHRFIPKFCAACNVSTDWLLTGEGKGPRREEYIKWVPKLTKRSAGGRRTKAA